MKPMMKKMAVVVASDPPSSGGDGPAADDATPPNFVLVLADDQGWGDVGYNAVPERTYNGTVLNPPKTPHIDAMASSPHSLVFHRFYVRTAPPHAAGWLRLPHVLTRTTTLWPLSSPPPPSRRKAYHPKRPKANHPKRPIAAARCPHAAGAAKRHAPRGARGVVGAGRSN